MAVHSGFIGQQDRRSSLVGECDEEIVHAYFPPQQRGPNGRGERPEGDEGPNGRDDDEEGAMAHQVIRRAQVISRWDLVGLACAFTFVIGGVTLGGAAVGLCVGIVGASRNELWLAKGAGMGGAVGLIMGIVISTLIYVFIVRRNMRSVIYATRSREGLMTVT